MCPPTSPATLMTLLPERVTPPGLRLLRLKRLRDLLGQALPGSAGLLLDVGALVLCRRQARATAGGVRAEPRNLTRQLEMPSLVGVTVGRQ